MEILIVAIITGLGLLIGMFIIWQDYRPSPISPTGSDESGTDENLEK
ncbi:hypothetical protein [Nitrospira sp. M1]